jgi:putative toxin-antitoxin system antitoxin component (TIGR02293 family)
MATALLAEDIVLDNSLMAREVRRGLPVALFFELRDALKVTPKILSETTHIPVRTLMRRKQKGERLLVDESERLLRLARIQQLAARALGGESRAREWMFRENRALGGETPFAYASTEPGAREVEAVLGRIEHGIFS